MTCFLFPCECVQPFGCSCNFSLPYSWPVLTAAACLSIFYRPKKKSALPLKLTLFDQIMGTTYSFIRTRAMSVPMLCIVYRLKLSPSLEHGVSILEWAALETFLSRCHSRRLAEFVESGASAAKKDNWSRKAFFHDAPDSRGPSPRWLLTSL